MKLKGTYTQESCARVCEYFMHVYAPVRSGAVHQFTVNSGPRASVFQSRMLRRSIGDVHLMYYGYKAYASQTFVHKREIDRNVWSDLSNLLSCQSLESSAALSTITSDTSLFLYKKTVRTLQSVTTLNSFANYDFIGLPNADIQYPLFASEISSSKVHIFLNCSICTSLIIN